MGQLSFGSLSKTHGLVHETGLAPEHAPDPTEHEASHRGSRVVGGGRGEHMLDVGARTT